MDLSTRVGLDKIVADTQQALSFYYNSSTLGRYILPWSRYEDAAKLAERIERTMMQFRNYPREIAQKYIEGLKRRQDSIVRTSTDSDFQKFLDGWYDSWFWREVAPVALLLPEVYIMLVATEKGGYRPAVVFPQYVTNFDMDPNLDLISIDMRINNARMMQLNSQGVIYYTSEKETDGNTKWWPVNDGEPYRHNLGFCPAVRIAYEENVEIATLEGTPSGHSFMFPLIQMTWADLQYRSMMTEAGYDHLHYQIVMSEKTAKTTAMTGMGSDMPIIEGSEEHGSTRYLSKPSFEMQTLRQIIKEDNPKEIFEAARLQGRFSNSAQTGAARLADLYPENGVLTNIAQYFWDLDDRILQMLARAMDVSVDVRWPTIFDTRGPSEALQDANLFVALAPKLPVAPSAIKEMTKNLQHVVLPGMPSGMLAQFDKETDRAPIPFMPPEVQQQIEKGQRAVVISSDGSSVAGGDGANKQKQLPPAGTEGGGSSQNTAGGGAGNEDLGGGGPGAGPDDLRDGGNVDPDGTDDNEFREVADPMALAFVACCETGAQGKPSEEEQEYEQMIEGLQEAEYEVEFINLANSLDALASLDPDVMVWNAVEGFHDKAQFEMHVAAYFELHHFRFTGSGAKALGLIQDKALTKTVLAGVGLAVKNAVLLRRGVDTPDMSHLAWPRMVKPAAEDASEGITAENVTHNDEEMQRVVSRLYTITDSILVEEYVEGREILVGILGNGKERVVLPPMEIEFTGEAKIVTKDAKQNSDSKDFDEVVTKDAVLTDTERTAIEQAVLTATRALGVQDYARVDIRLTKEGVPVIIEVNPNPDLSPDHGFGGSAQLAGMKFPDLLDRIVKIAQKRYEPRGAQ